MIVLVLLLKLLKILICSVEDGCLAVGGLLALLTQERRAGRHGCNDKRKLLAC